MALSMTEQLIVASTGSEDRKILGLFGQLSTSGPLFGSYFCLLLGLPYLVLGGIKKGPEHYPCEGLGFMNTLTCAVLDSKI